MQPRDHDKEYRESQARQREFELKAEEYLGRLTKVSSIDDLLQVVRDAAGWALVAHREDMTRRAR